MITFASEGKSSNQRLSDYGVSVMKIVILHRIPFDKIRYDQIIDHQPQTPAHKN
jgi:hypothetical protein